MALVAMPFAPIQIPSLGLGLLHGAMAARGVRTKTFHFSLKFASRIGTHLYDQISDGEPARSDLVGDWVFNGELFDEGQLDIEGYVREVLRSASPHHRCKRFRSGVQIDAWIEKLFRIRAKAGPFLDECVATLLAHQPRIVGITSMFQEHVAALALGKRLKAARPDVFLVLGGSNCEGEMGLETARQFPFLDAVVSGEGDLVFPSLVDEVLEARPLSSLQGVYRRGQIGPETTPSVALPIEHMDDLPYPVFDDHVTQLEAEKLDFDDIASPHLMFETARGCWWGQVNHCTFCGLNGATMRFRSKSPERAFEELQFLTRNYPGRPLAVSDNILDWKYLKDFVPRLRDANLGLNLFYEVKSNLKKEEIRLLRDAGIRRMQPGIESFSTPILKLMRKGVSGIQNIQMLKWCCELGVKPEWGLLWGFPGEDPLEYERMANMLPLLTHLSPPIGVSRIRLDRFSPNHTHAEAAGFVDVQPFPAYDYVYPLGAASLQNLAYFFSYRLADGVDPEKYVAPLLSAAAEWERVHGDSALFYVDKQSALLVWDLRASAWSNAYVLSGVARDLYLACDRARTAWQLRDDLSAHRGEDLRLEAVTHELDGLVAARLMIQEGQSYLSLAVRLGEYTLSRPALRRFLTIVGQMGQNCGSEIVIPLEALPGGGGTSVKLSPRANSEGEWHGWQ